MNIDKAALITYEVACFLRPFWQETSCPEMTFEHLENMWFRWSDDMSDTKKCRWLGWMQACVVAMTYPVATLGTMKQINRDCVSPSGPIPVKTVIENIMRENPL